MSSLKESVNNNNRRKMKHLRKFIYVMIPILLALPFSGLSQNTEQKNASDEKLINAAREIMAAAGTCALITLDAKNLPRVRVMDPFPPESDFTVWFGTNTKTRKVEQIKNNPNVTLYYLDSDSSGYVMIQGMAHLVNDPKEKEKRWKAEWEAFYPDRSEGYLLIKVSPTWMEVISYKHGILGDPVTWQAPAVRFDSIK
jgi:general stress protein 26